MKSKFTSRRIHLVALAFVALFFGTFTPAHAQLDETCKVLINNQIVQVGFGGEFRIRNIPAGNNLLRIYAICTKAGVTRYGRSVFNQVRGRQTITLSELDFIWRNTPFPTTAAINAVADNATLSQINDSTQIRVTATLSDSTKKDVTSRGFGSSYTSSNPSVASVDLQGRVTANGIGTALITVNNEGATAVTRITVAPANLLTTVEGLVQLESGAAAIGATVVVPGFGETIVTDTTGKFSFSGIYAPLGSLKARAYNMVNNQLLLGLTGNLRLIQGGITDAGIIVIKPVTNYVYWKDAVSGAWNDATKWSTNAVPTTNDNVFIGVPGSITVTYSQNITTTIKSLLCDESFTLSAGSFAFSDSSEMTSIFTFSNGTLAGNGALTIFGALTWSGGTMAAGGSTNIAASGLMDLSTATAKFSNRTINNFGTNTVSGAGNFNISSGSSFNNQVGGIFAIGSDGNILGNGSFNNMGMLRKTGATGITSFNGPRFNNNSGTVDMLTGTLNLFSGGTSTGGIFTVASGASLLFNIVTHVFSGAYSGSGTGLIQLTGTIQINANGATFNFTGGGFQWSSGTISGPGTLTNTGSFNMTGGAFNNKILRGGATINNSGTVTSTGGGTISGGEGSVFNNLAGGTFDIRDNAFFDGDGLGGTRTTFINAGRIVKSAGTGTSTLEVTFNNNNGTIEAQTGTLALTAGGNNTGGTFTVADTASLNLSSGAFAYTRGTINVTTGVVNLSGGTHKFSGNYSGSGVGSIQLSGGTLQIDTTVVATFNFAGGGFQWSSGTISGPGTLTNTGSFNMTGGAFNNKILRGGATINNSGTVTWTGGGTISGGEGSVFNNLAGGTFDIRDNAFFDGDGIGGTRTVFINAGRIAKSAGTGTSTLEVTFNNNNGTIEAQIGALALTAGGNNTGGTFTVADTASLNLSSGAFAYTRGTINVTTGVVNLSGGTHKFSGNYSGSGVGSIQLSGGTLQIDTTVVATFNFAGGGFRWTGGTISGPGTLTNTGNFNMTGPFSNKILRGGATINNSGTVTWTGTGTIFGGGSSVFNNQADGTFDIRDNAFFDGDGIGGTRTVFINAGRIAKSAGTGTSTLEVTFNNNNGTIEAQIGALALTAGGNNTGGTFTVADTASLNLSSGAFAYTGGTINVTTGVVNLSGGTHKFSGNYSGSGAGSIQLSGGTLQIDTTVVATFNFAGGGFQWSGGTISGPGALTNTGNFNMTGPFSNKILRGGATINNSGTVTWTGTGTIFGGGSSFFNNQAGGTFDIRDNAFFDGDGIGGTRTVFINAGRIVKSAGTSTSTLEVTFNNNNGAIEAQTGTLALTAGGNNTGGTFTVANTANLNLSSGNFLYTGGNINVTSGALNLSGGTHKFSGNYSGSGVGFVQLSGGTLKVDTTVVITFNFMGGGFQWSSGTISGPGALTNTGNFNMTGPVSNKILRGGATINNSGTVTWTGTGTILGGERTVFNNLAGGTFNIQVDAFFDGDGIGGTRTVFNNVGSVIKSAGTGTTTMEVTFNNANGNINVQTGTLTLSAGGNKTGGIFTVATGANLNFSGTHVFSGSFSGAIDGIVDFGTFQIDAAGATLNFPGQGFTWNSGTISGPGALTNTGNFNMTGPVSNKILRGGATINNSGTVTWTGTGTILGGERTVFNNLAGGTFNIQVDAFFDGDGIGGTRTVFNNVGSVIKSAGTGTTTMEVTFNNANGNINVQTGTLTLSAGGNKTGGIFTVATGANLNFSGTHVFSGSFSGAIDGIVDFGTFQIDAAGATLNFPGQGFTWNSGTISGPGALTNTGNFNMRGPVSNKILRGGATINNSGTVTWTGTGTIFGGEGSVFNNLAGGTFNIQVDAFFDGDGISGTRTVFNNVGSVIKSAGTGTTTMEVTFNNANGTINVQTGTLNFSSTFTQTAGATILNGGNLSSSQTLNIQGGSVSGAGTITANVSNGGAFIPGVSPGILNITGTYTQTRPPQAGALNIELNGTAATQFDQLKMTGAATLGGTLNLSLIIPFSPNIGDSFVIMTFSGRGGTQFDNVTGQNIGGGRVLNVIYNLTNVTVQVVAGGAER